MKKLLFFATVMISSLSVLSQNKISGQFYSLSQALSEEKSKLFDKCFITQSTNTLKISLNPDESYYFITDSVSKEHDTVDVGIRAKGIGSFKPNDENELPYVIKDMYSHNGYYPIMFMSISEIRFIDLRDSKIRITGDRNVIPVGTYYSINDKCYLDRYKLGEIDGLKNCIDSLKFVSVKVNEDKKMGQVHINYHGKSYLITDVMPVFPNGVKSDVPSLISSLNVDFMLEMKRVVYGSGEKFGFWIQGESMKYRDEYPIDELKKNVLVNKEKVDEANEKRNELIALYGTEYGNAIFNGEYVTGMSMEMFDLALKNLWNVYSQDIGSEYQILWLRSILDDSSRMKVTFKNEKLISYKLY